VRLQKGLNTNNSAKKLIKWSTG